MQFSNLDDIMPEYIERTLKNLKFIESDCTNGCKVTQLINSFVGLLILPKERAFNRIVNADVSRDLLCKIKSTVKICKTKMEKQKM